MTIARGNGRSRTMGKSFLDVGSGVDCSAWPATARLLEDEQGV
jgi:hypothetical protein